MKKRLNLIIILILLLPVTKTIGQDNINQISFNYTNSHWAKPKISKIFISITKTHNDYILYVHINKMKVKDYAEEKAYSIAMANLNTEQDSIIINKREASKKYTDNTYKITSEEFNRIVSSIMKIKPAEISNKFIENGSDGYSCSIQFGGTQNSITYQIWTPGHKPEKRKIKNFTNTCKLILSIAGINPKKVL